MENEVKSGKKRDEILEIIVVVLLGITALLTAWASWVGSLHGGNQAGNYAKSNNLSADGHARWNQAIQELSSDMQLWNTISQLRIDYAYAESQKDTQEMERYEWKLNQIYADNVSDELMAAIDWADEQKEYASPFEKEGFVDSYYADAQAVLDEAQEILEQGEADNTHGDAFGLVLFCFFWVSAVHLTVQITKPLLLLSVLLD